MKVHACRASGKIIVAGDLKELDLFADYMRRMTRATDAGVSADEAAASIYGDVYADDDEQDGAP